MIIPLPSSPVVPVPPKPASPLPRPTLNDGDALPWPVEMPTGAWNVVFGQVNLGGAPVGFGADQKREINGRSRWA